MTRHEQIKKRCQEFHLKHPDVWEMFCRFTFDRIHRGFESYSADAIFHRIRWETTQPKYEKGEEFKLNNNYTAFYGRRFMTVYPQHNRFFKLRTQLSKDKLASHLPELGPDDFP